MFIDDLYALKNSFPERLQLYFLFTREEQEYPIFSGRLDGEKTSELVKTFCNGLNARRGLYVCGPDTMIESVRAALSKILGMVNDAVIHVERYGAPRKKAAAVATEVPVSEHDCTVTVIMDGHKKSFQMASEGSGIVDAAAEQGIELPFSCKGGVCATCRTHVREGEVPDGHELWTGTLGGRGRIMYWPARAIH